MRLRKGVVAAFAALLCGTYIVASDPSTASAQPVPEFGFASLATLASTSASDHNAYAAQVKNVGASWVRLVVPWNNVEANRGTYNWATVDPAVLAARANGTKILLLLTGPAPYWAQALLGNPLSGAGTPADPATFGAFAAAAANRYKDYASTWEIWNEPNDPTFFQSPNVPRYVQLLKAAYQSIHAVQPNAVVVTGGVTSTPAATISDTSFVDQLYSNGAKPFLDGIGMHPYTIPYGISDDPKHVWNNLAIARTTMTNNGDAAKKIWVTEWGLPTGTSAYASTEAKQASRLVEALQTAAATPYLAPLFVFTVRDLNTDTSNPDANYGVFKSDGNPKQAAYAIQQYASGGGQTPPTTTTPTTTTPTTAPPPTTTTPPPAPSPQQNFVFVLGRILGWW
ncbi:beta-1,4-xylanase [Mycobacterium sp. JS623]|uniref:cellulase family glycosylhydrolase n=1 Tax=Mycobacterium sp. JS623 TaxID=212767 RepID=UPI0002A56832|nr:cellulase family glycosylhydrolase [Mycobacterium sp. JS623]AGB24959.1 beta-1,4-xylanase [Mycobacterium sp. JS623]